MPSRSSPQTKLAQQAAKLRHLRQLSNLWDNYLGIPGTKLRVGLESLVGLLPFGGDAIGVVLSSYIVLQALQFGLPSRILSRMIFNILLDGVAGSIPFLGDLFDTTWKANSRNVNLLEDYLQSPQPGKRANKWLMLILLVGVLLVVVALGVATAAVFHALFHALH